MNKQEKITEILQTALNPSRLEVIDDSHLHAGHTHNNGKGHFTVVISTANFDGLSRLQQHQMVYEALGEMMNNIHALSIKIC